MVAGGKATAGQTATSPDQDLRASLHSEPSLYTADAFYDAIYHHLKYSLGTTRENCTRRELFRAMVLAVRDRLIDRMLETEAWYRKADAKRLYYLSMEFLIGRSLDTNLSNLGILELCRNLCQEMGVDLEDMLDNEKDAALGNGGLGRLAACFLDSLATLGMPGYGYGINYEYGLFKQVIEDGYQKEQPDYWLPMGSPWLIERPDEACLIPLYGRLEHSNGQNGKPMVRWVDWKVVIGVPNDMPIAGYGGQTVNILRLYSAKSSHEFDMQVFNRGDYLKAVEQKIASEMISKVLYPSDSVEAGRELRLIQEYFLAACALDDIIRHYLKSHDSFDDFPAKVAIQMNDTHPSLAVAELMRRLLDEHHLPWDRAWEITQATLAYTNHTLLPEALEKWPVSLFEYVLPRHLQIIYEINERFLKRVAAIWPDDLEHLRRMSIIEEGDHKRVRMAHLAIVGSHSVNGVSELHSALVQTALVPDFYQLWPERFNNKTNGITQRRWLLRANPELAALLTTTIGNGWITNLDELQALEPYANDAAFQHAFMRIKHDNKVRLAHVIRDTTGVTVVPESLFDIHIKRIHEYKRQTLNVLHIIHMYLRVVEDQQALSVPRTFVFAGKAAPEYWAAKQVIKLIHNVAEVINNDPRVADQLKVVFIPDYRVSLAEKIIPAADLSEQISTAGMEASGTSNMKFALNGALTIGTLDGANIEIRQEVGEENMFIFGLRTEEIQELRRRGTYRPRDYYQRHPAIQRIMDALYSNVFSPQEPGLFHWLYRAILDYGDYYFHLADLEYYIATQEEAAQEFTRQSVWARKAIFNVARIGKFSSDRTVREYARDIWQIDSILLPHECVIPS
jgi:starch phosphorylase